MIAYKDYMSIEKDDSIELAVRPINCGIYIALKISRLLHRERIEEFRNIG